jgi:hypothetical protein
MPGLIETKPTEGAVSGFGNVELAAGADLG